MENEIADLVWPPEVDDEHSWRLSTSFLFKKSFRACFVLHSSNVWKRWRSADKLYSKRWLLNSIRSFIIKPHQFIHYKAPWCKHVKGFIKYFFNFFLIIDTVLFVSAVRHKSTIVLLSTLSTFKGEETWKRREKKRERGWLA